MKVACTSVTSSPSFIADKDVVRIFSQMELRPDMAVPISPALRTVRWDCELGSSLGCMES